VASTAGGLALLGAILGTIGAYLAIAAAYFSDLDSLTPVPVLSLAVIALGAPLPAGVAGWLVSGSEPTVSEPAID
jgi:putative ABC transport system permease protein